MLHASERSCKIENICNTAGKVLLYRLQCVHIFSGSPMLQAVQGDPEGTAVKIFS